MTALPAPSRTRLIWEISLVLLLSLGQSAIYSVLSLVRALTRDTALAQQSTSLNPSRAPEPIWDITYQVLGVAFDLCLVALALYLIWQPGEALLRRIGLDFTRPLGDLGRAVALLAIIGIPGLGLYALGRILGITVQVNAAPLDPSWWTIPLLVLSAIRAGLLEEVIMNSYLVDRLRRVGWGPWTIILAAAGLRGAYHAYQGFGAIIGNIVMGIVFGWCYRRWGRVMPLVAAHALIDIIAFVGYPLAAPYLP